MKNIELPEKERSIEISPNISIRDSLDFISQELFRNQIGIAESCTKLIALLNDLTMRLSEITIDDYVPDSESVLIIIDNLLYFSENTDESVNINKQVAYIAVYALKILLSRSAQIPIDKEYVAMHLLNSSIKQDIYLYGEIVMHLVKVSSVNLLFKMADSIIPFIVQSFHADRILFLKVQANILLYQSEDITEMCATAILDATLDYISGEMNEPFILAYASKIIKSSCSVATTLGIPYFIGIKKYIEESSDFEALRPLKGLITNHISLMALYESNYNMAKSFEKLLNDFAYKIDFNFFCKLLPEVLEDDDYFYNLSIILCFHIANNPECYSNPDTSMFIWDFMANNYADRNMKTKDAIMRIFSFMLNEICYVDESFIIFDLNIFEILVYHLTYTRNIFHVLDVTVFFLNAAFDLGDYLYQAACIIEESSLFDIISERKDDCDKEWLSSYLQVALDMTNELIDKSDKFIENEI